MLKPLNSKKNLHNDLLQSQERAVYVMLNLFQHLIKSMGHETLKQVRGDREKIFARFAIFLIIVLAFTVTPSFADYKIILKNGREFVVDDYKDLNGKIKFYREGGEIELDKDIIKDIKKVKAVKRTEESSPADTTTDTTPEKLPTEKSAQPQKQEIDSKLKELGKKKAQFMAEKEKLMSEGKKLEEDIKKEGKVVSIREKREFDRRRSELETKIKKFDEEFSKLEQEEEMLLKERGTQQKKQ